MTNLFSASSEDPIQVECFGRLFSSESARREHFIQILREKLKDIDFRKTSGFPVGTDEDILALSDPPYYTACPNPFIDEFTKYYGTNHDNSILHNKEPFAVDVSEGKNDPVYLAHSYHTKVPHKAIMRYILHYTQPGEVIFDGFCGTGMTGIAADLCGDKNVVQSLGYKVDENGDIYSPELVDTKTVWNKFSKLGKRHAILNDLSPAATFIAHNYNTPGDSELLKIEANRILKEVEDECGWLYETKHTDGRIGRINYTVWSDVYVCSECTSEVVFWDVAVNRAASEVRDEFLCPHCSAMLSKRTMERAWTNVYDPDLKLTIKTLKHVPVLINYSIGGRREEKRPDTADLELISRIEGMPIPYWIPTDEIIPGKEIGRLQSIGITHVNQIIPKRANWVLGAFLERCSNPKIKLAISASLLNLSWMYRWRANGKGGTTSGTYYICATPQENNAFNQLTNKIDDLSNVICHAKNLTSTQDSSHFKIP
jgi:DNA-directed RNA polymerase subunit RPC12/RpoP